MTLITESNVYEHGKWHYVAFASDLGLKPREFPRTLDTTLGNSLPFVFSCTADSDPGRMEYQQTAGVTSLTVFND